MRLGFIVPTSLESINLSPLNAHVTSAGYGAGKTAACAAAADLIFKKHCDTIVIWGLAGSLSKEVGVNDILIGTSVAYRDYDIAPLAGSTGVGFVQDFAENIWVDLDQELAENLYKSMKELFPDRKVVKGRICTGDQFVQHESPAGYNRVEKDSYGVDMESAALAHFCHLVDKNVKEGIVRIISDNADHNANINFSDFLEEFGRLNSRMYTFREKILAENSSLTRLVPYCGNITSLTAEKKLFDEACHKMYDRFLVEEQDSCISAVIAGKGESCHFAKRLAEMFAVPFLNPPFAEKDLAGKELLMVCDKFTGMQDLHQVEAVCKAKNAQLHHILAFAGEPYPILAEDLQKADIRFTCLVKKS